MRFSLYAVLTLTFIALSLTADAVEFTIVHTNDLHSHFLGFAPNIDYTPSVVGDDETVGGWARIATVIKEVKESRDNPVLVLDAGDFLMGSFFHTLCREQSFELRLMKEMGYDVISMGNHEFDLVPSDLASTIQTAHQYTGIPSIVLSNVAFSTGNSMDDPLEEMFQRGLVNRYIVLEREGVRIGFFGLMGKDAAEFAEFTSSVKFSDPVKTAQAMVEKLRNDENADIVICLSHSGLDLENEKRSEDVILAKKVSGIDIIISGHSHTRLDKALNVNDTIIVQAWGYGRQVGILDVTYSNDDVSVKDYKTVMIDDSIRSDDRITQLIQSFESMVNERVLVKGYNFREVIANTNFELSIDTDESNLGNLIADAIRWYVNLHEYDPDDPDTKVLVSAVSNGLIRDNIVPGKTGKVALCDIFRTIPLGVGADGTMGYPLVSFYLHASEIKKALEVLTTICPMRGSDYFLQVSGLKFVYNPRRLLFKRVTDIWLGDEETGYTQLDYSDSNQALYKIAVDIYNGNFLKIIDHYVPFHILQIVPKDRDGNPIGYLGTARVDADKDQPGIQELKEWVAVVEYIKSFPDTDGDGLPNIPEKYRGKQGRIVAKTGWNLSWQFYLIILIIFIAVTLVIFLIVRKVRRKRA